MLKSFHVTEKSSADVTHHKYVFIVSTRTAKKEIKSEVESRYKVKVQRVNLINLPGKERKRGRQIGWKAGARKAIVTIQEGQKIEIE